MAQSTIFFPAVNPRECTGLHLVWACKIENGEFEFGYHFNNRCLLLGEKHCHSLFIRLLTELDREEVHLQTIQMIKW